MAQRIDVLARVARQADLMARPDAALVQKGETSYLLVKRILDLVVASVLLVLLAPLLLLIALLIHLDSPGPVLLTQKRVGQGGRIFGFFKFRTMFQHINCEAHREFACNYVSGRFQPADRAGAALFKPAAKQVTRVGRILRRASLDELPQLLNVLRGEMSLVGPRPSIYYELEAYKPWHLRRLEALPGMTGWAQIHGRSTLAFDRIVELDLEYLRSRSLRKDLVILLRTVPVVVSGKGAG